MWPDIGELRDFYRTDRGQAVRHVIRRRIRSLWPDLQGRSVIGIGYATPFLPQFKDEVHLLAAFSPAAMGAPIWPLDQARKVTVIEEDAWPLPDASIDRLLLIHCLEFVGDTENFLREIWRVLVPGGRAMVVVPQRRSLWAQSETTPFGFGQPYSFTQLQRLFSRQMFRSHLLARGLHLPLWWPRPGLGVALNIERYGARWARGMGGLLFFEAEKQLYGAIPLRNSSRRIRFALPSLPLKPA